MIVVIGAGPAGRYAAMRLASSGREVMMVDRRPEGLGGQCLHQGCMVICALNDIARMVDTIGIYHDQGLISSIPSVSYTQILKQMREVIGTIAGVIYQETSEAKVQIVQGIAQLDGGVVLVDGQKVAAESVIIATGTLPYLPNIPGISLPGVYTAHTILSMDSLPRRMVIIGAGVIAAEYAYLFSVFGVRVTILARSSLLRTFPLALVHEARKDLHRVRVLEETSIMRIEGEGQVQAVIVKTSDGEERIETDSVLVAAGMTPCMKGIYGIQSDDNGWIKLSDQLETSQPGVYAAGDVTGTGFLTPVARRQGRAVADRILGLTPLAPPALIPQAIKLRQDLAFSKDGKGGKSLTMPGAAGPGTFWMVPKRLTGKVSLTTDSDGTITGMAEASPCASVASSYAGWLITQGVKVQDLDQFMEIHPSSDGLSWLAKFIASKIEYHRD